MSRHPCTAKRLVRGLGADCSTGLKGLKGLTFRQSRSAPDAPGWRTEVDSPPRVFALAGGSNRLRLLPPARAKTRVTTQTLIIFLLLGASASLNAALIAGILARLCGSATPQAALVAGPAFIAVFSMFIAAWGNLT